MRYILKEFIYVIAAFCSIYAIVYIYLSEDWQCRAWGGLGAVIATYVGYKISKRIFRKKNQELKDMSKRKKALEIIVLKDKRLGSGYEPDDHV